MKEYRIRPDVLQKYVHQSLIDVFGDIDYFSYYDEKDDIIGTTSMAETEKLIISHLIDPRIYAFPLYSGERVKMSFACDFYDTAQLNTLMRQSLEKTINAIAENEAEFKEEEDEED